MFQQHIPTVNLADDDPANARPPKTSTPIKATPEVDRSHSGKKLNISKIKGAYLLFEMQDRQEKTWEKKSEGKDQVATSQWVARGGPGSAGELPPGLPAKLPKFPERDVASIKPSNPGPEASSQGKKHPLYADDEIVELDHDKVTGPPKKKKKKKNKSKDKSKDETPCRKPRMSGHVENNPVAKPEAVAEEPAPVPTAPGNSGGGKQGSKEEKEEECRAREVPTRAEGS